MSNEDKTLSRAQLSWPLSWVWFHRTQGRAWLWQRDFPSSSFVSFNPSATQQMLAVRLASTQSMGLKRLGFKVPGTISEEVEILEALERVSLPGAKQE